MNILRFSPEYLHETARFFRYLMDELDYTHWRVDVSWRHLDVGWQGFSSGAAEEGYEATTVSMRQLAEIFYRCAWELEATVARLEDADARAATDFGDVIQLFIEKAQ